MLRISCMSCIVGQVPVYRVLCCACISICMKRWSGGQYATLIYPCVIPYSLRFLCNRRTSRLSLQEVACWSNQDCKVAEKLDKAYSFRGHMQDGRGRRVPNSQAKTSNFDPHSSSILPNPLPSPSLRNGTLWYRYLYGSIDFPLFFTISLAIRGRVRKQTLVASGHHRHHKVEQYGCPNVLSSFDNRTF